MKNILFLASLVFVLSCENKTEDPIQACPLSIELDQLEVKFDLVGSLPIYPKLYLSALEVQDCNYAPSDEFCITGSQIAPGSIVYNIRSLNQVQTNLQVELYDDRRLRLARSGETLTRVRTRPDDACGSGYISKVTIQE